MCLRKGQRRAHLQDIVVHTNVAEQNSAILHLIDYPARFHGCRCPGLAVEYKLGTEEKAVAANIADEVVLAL